MRTLLHTVVTVWLACLFSAQTSAEQRVYTVGIVPQFEAHTLHAIWHPLLDRLEQETGAHFSILGSTNIPAFERDLAHGKFDFAYMNPYHLIVANEQAGYVPLVRDHGRQLQGVLVVKKGSTYKSPKDLQGKTIAFPAPNALGASLQMRQELTDIFGITFEPRYVKTHDSVYLNVLLNEADAGGGVQKTLNQQRPEYQSALEVIYRTKKVAPHPFCASPTVPENLRSAVTTAFMKFGESESDRELLSNIPIKRIGLATLKDYQQLKDINLSRFYVSQSPLDEAAK